MQSPLQSPLQPVMRSPLEFRRRGGGSFDIASTNPSAYYDRTNLATLFQYSAGTTPVTAAGQPIGLGLDQSQGLALGPELVVNGDFSGGLTGWNYAAGTTVVAGQARIVGIHAAGIGTGNNSLTPSPDFSIVGKFYQMEFDATYISGGFNIQAGSQYSPVLVITPAANGGVKTRYSLLAITPFGKTPSIGITGVGGAWDIDNISVKLLAGNHQSQATAGKRPVTAGSPIYANFDAVDDDLVATFPASLGSGCTVCRSLPGTGASITTGVTLTATYTDNVDAHALLIYTSAQWAALNAGQIANITTWLNGRAGL